ncbi:MAG TPA: hypothetical protein VE961_18675, partial [Pyrinomonadaceae bacterium]|nr:hypothetical protein [Pyrinomonadaceae bacterium]
MMKRFLFASVSLLAIGFTASAYAGGSSSFTSQTGTNQTLTIDQTGGNNNQVGTGINPFLQENGAGTGGNVINITQTGANNTFGVGIASVQSGTQNFANINQSGSNSSVNLRQIGNFNGVSNDHDASDGIAAEVVGENEGSFIKQSASFSSVNVFETGNGNAFFITQQGGTKNAIGVTQQGDENYVTMNQNGSSLFASVGQFGTLNTVTSTQTGVGNQLFAGQTGNNNVLNNDQSGFSNVLVS